MGDNAFFVEGAASGIVGGVAAFFGVAGEEVSQESATAAEAAHDRADGDVEVVGDFFVGLVFDVGHDDDGLEVFRDRVECRQHFIGETVEE